MDSKHFHEMKEETTSQDIHEFDISNNEVKGWHKPKE